MTRSKEVTPTPAPRFLRPPFTLTYEVNPPKGADGTKALEQARRVAPFVDAINLTDCPLSSLRMSPMPLAHRIQQELGVPTIPHVTSRDRNLLGIQSELLGLAFMGVKHVFALTGDPIKIGDHPDAKGVYELYANQLIELVHKLNKGADHVGNKLDAPTDFSVGSAVTLTDTRPDGLQTFQRKLEAGADFFQTQIVLDPKTLDEVPAAYETEKPILVGVTPLRSKKMLETFKTIPGVRVTERVEARLKNASDFAAEANRLVVELADAVKGRYAGLHLMPVVPDEAQLAALFQELRPRPTPRVAARAEAQP